MTLLPIVERELRVTARRSGVYRNRCLVPALLLLIVWGQMVFVPFLSSPATVGRMLYNTLSFLGFAICVLDGVRQTADCISEEKREGTLGLLFLTDLNGYDVILGKLAAAVLASIHSLLAMVPILGCALFLGGVTPGEIIRIALALASLLFFSLATGLWVSSRSRSASHAMGGTLLLLFLVLLLPLFPQFGSIVFLSPAWAFFGSSDLNYGSRPLAYWASLLFAQLFVLCLLAMAAVNTNLFREDQPARPSKEKKRRTTPVDDPARQISRAELLTANPVSWLAGFHAGSGFLIWALVLLAAGSVGGFLISNLVHPRTNRLGGDLFWVSGIVVLVHLVLKVLLAAQASRCLAEARRSSTLEILLCTPLTVEDILRGQVLALKRTFLKPFLLVMLMEMIGIFWALHDQFGGSGSGHENFGDIVIALEVAFVLFFLLDIQGVAWTGIWFGLCSKNESTATFKTAFYVIVLPILLLLVLFCLGVPCLILWPIAAYVWARLQLQEHFRFLAGQRLISSGKLTSWLPFHVPNLPQDSRPD